MTAQTILEEIEPLGSNSYKQILFKHGAKEPCFGVKIDELKKIQKRVKTDHRLALDLYDTGIYDAMYLAGLIADDARMTKEDLRRWAAKACAPLAGSTVSWVAAGSPHGWKMALEWIDADEDLIAAAGWATLSSLVATKDDAELDLAGLKRLLKRVQTKIHQAPDAVRSPMNGFVVAVGSSVQALSTLALETGESIGPVTVDKGDTVCKVPFAPDAIRKAAQRGAIGKKRRTAKC